MPDGSKIDVNRVFALSDRQSEVVALTVLGNGIPAIASILDSSIPSVGASRNMACQTLGVKNLADLRKTWLKAHPDFDTRSEPVEYGDIFFTLAEKKIGDLTAEGKNSTEISAIMGLVRGTVANYRASLFQKLGVTSMAEFIYAWENLSDEIKERVSSHQFRANNKKEVLAGKSITGRIYALTPRQSETAALTVLGNSAPEAARILGIGVASVLDYRKSLYKVLEIHDVSELREAWFQAYPDFDVSEPRDYSDLYFTPKEREIADLKFSGKSSEEIAEVLNESVRVVNARAVKLYQKLGVRNSSEFSNVWGSLSEDIKQRMPEQSHSERRKKEKLPSVEDHEEVAGKSLVSPVYTLTDAQSEFAALVALGNSRRAIASILNTDIATVRNLQSAVYRALGVRSFAELKEFWLTAYPDLKVFQSHDYSDLHLTYREKQIGILKFSGKSPEEIQDALKLSEVTLRSHTRQLYKKLGVWSFSDFLEAWESLGDEFKQGISIQDDNSDAVFAPRQKEIALLMISGRSNSQIAGVLGVDPATVNTIQRTIYQRLGVQNFAEFLGACEGVSEGFEQAVARQLDYGTIEERENFYAIPRGGEEYAGGEDGGAGFEFVEDGLYVSAAKLGEYKIEAQLDDELEHHI